MALTNRSLDSSSWYSPGSQIHQTATPLNPGGPETPLEEQAAALYNDDVTKTPHHPLSPGSSWVGAPPKSFGKTRVDGKGEASPSLWSPELQALSPKPGLRGPQHVCLTGCLHPWCSSSPFSSPTSVLGCPIFCSGRDKMYKWWVVDKVYSSAAGSSSIIFHMSTDNWCKPCRRSSIRWEEGKIKSAVRSQAADLYLTFFLI